MSLGCILCTEIACGYQKLCDATLATGVRTCSKSISMPSWDGIIRSWGLKSLVRSVNEYWLWWTSFYWFDDIILTCLHQWTNLPLKYYWKGEHRSGSNGTINFRTQYRSRPIPLNEMKVYSPPPPPKKKQRRKWNEKLRKDGKWLEEEIKPKMTATCFVGYFWQSGGIVVYW